MIPKSGYRFSDKIMLKQKMSDESDSTQLNQTLAVTVFADQPRRFVPALEAELADSRRDLLDRKLGRRHPGRLLDERGAMRYAYCALHWPPHVPPYISASASSSPGGSSLMMPSRTIRVRMVSPVPRVWWRMSGCMGSTIR